MDIPIERRKHKRYKYQAVISHDIMSLEIIYSGRVHNLSDGGLYFESNQILHTGEEIYIWTGNDPDLADSDTQILVTAEILWFNGSSGSSFKYGYGAKLINSNTAFEKIIDYHKTLANKPVYKKKKKRREVVGTFLKDHGLTWTPAVFIYVFLLTFFIYKTCDFQLTRSAPLAMENPAISQKTVVRGKLSYQRAESPKQSDIRQLTQRKFTIYFRRNSNELSYQAHQTLIEITRFISQYPQSKIVIEGFTDSRGRVDRNKSLSKTRAALVKDYLIDMGTNPKKIDAVGHGPQNFLASNETAKGRRLNRRVEVTVGF